MYIYQHTHTHKYIERYTNSYLVKVLTEIYISSLR